MNSPPPAPGSAVDTAGAIELLERALAFTCGALATVTPADLDQPTPCRDWTLADLLAHMEDCLDAFTEGAGGRVDRRPRASTDGTGILTMLRFKATRLLGAWTPLASPLVHDEVRDDVRFGEHTLPLADVAGIAAVEIAVHGWDVAATTARRGVAAVPMPPTLAGALEPWARCLVVNDIQADGAGQPRRFAPPIADAAMSDPVRRLLGMLGRRA